MLTSELRRKAETETAGESEVPPRLGDVSREDAGVVGVGGVNDMTAKARHKEKKGNTKNEEFLGGESLTTGRLWVRLAMA